MGKCCAVNPGGTSELKSHFVQQEASKVDSKMQGNQDRKGLSQSSVCSSFLPGQTQINFVMAVILHFPLGKVLL